MKLTNFIMAGVLAVSSVFNQEAYAQSKPPVNAAAQGVGEFERDNGGRPISLIDNKKQPVTNKMFEGKYSVGFAGFTTCPGPCPKMRHELIESLKRINQRDPALGRGLQGFMITIDPKRDTPEQLTSYFSGTQIRGITGSQESLDAVLNNIKIGHDFKELYHATMIYVLDPTRKVIAKIPFNSPDMNASLEQTVELVTGKITAAVKADMNKQGHAQPSPGR